VAGTVSVHGLSSLKWRMVNAKPSSSCCVFTMNGTHAFGKSSST